MTDRKWMSDYTTIYLRVRSKLCEEDSSTFYQLFTPARRRIPLQKTFVLTSHATFTPANFIFIKYTSFFHSSKITNASKIQRCALHSRRFELDQVPPFPLNPSAVQKHRRPICASLRSLTECWHRSALQANQCAPWVNSALHALRIQLEWEKKWWHW